MTFHIVHATVQDLDAVTALFDGYRQYYEQAPDLALARRFMAERLCSGDSIVFLAQDDEAALGFVQLFPAFSSVAARRLWILNDLYVDHRARRRGVARALMQHAARWSRDQGAVRLVLETLPENAPAQALYEDLGWRRGESLHYELTLD